MVILSIHTGNLVWYTLSGFSIPKPKIALGGQFLTFYISCRIWIFFFCTNKEDAKRIVYSKWINRKLNSIQLNVNVIVKKLRRKKHSLPLIFLRKKQAMATTTMGFHDITVQFSLNVTRAIYTVQRYIWNIGPSKQSIWFPRLHMQYDKSFNLYIYIWSMRSLWALHHDKTHMHFRFGNRQWSVCTCVRRDQR